MRREKEITLVQWLIHKMDTKSCRAGTLTGMLHPKADQKMINDIGGKHSLINQARELEQDEKLRGKFHVDWSEVRTDIKGFDFSVDIMDELCRREGVEHPRTRQLRYLEQMRKWKREAGTVWLDLFYGHLENRLEAGVEVKDVDLEDEKYFQCLNAIARNKEPVWERIFSAAILHDSKRFQEKYKAKMVTVLTRYSPFYEEGMTAEELLTAHGILSYAQTMEWKGPLQYQMESGEMIDTSSLVYGTVLNARTMEKAKPAALPGIRRIMTIENKANYESMEYAQDALYIYCHGFFSPKERRFLKHLTELAGPDTEYLHWGDMDYGGIRIFQFNQGTLFPLLKPYRMGRKEFLRAAALHAGIEIDPEKRRKLEAMDAGCLEELKRCILETNMEIEQEILLARQYREVLN